MGERNGRERWERKMGEREKEREMGEGGKIHERTRLQHTSTTTHVGASLIFVTVMVTDPVIESPLPADGEKKFGSSVTLMDSV